MQHIFLWLNVWTLLAPWWRDFQVFYNRKHCDRGVVKPKVSEAWNPEIDAFRNSWWRKRKCKGNFPSLQLKGHKCCLPCRDENDHRGNDYKDDDVTTESTAEVFSSSSFFLSGVGSQPQACFLLVLKEHLSSRGHCKYCKALSKEDLGHCHSRLFNALFHGPSLWRTLGAGKRPEFVHRSYGASAPTFPFSAMGPWASSLRSVFHL